MNLSAAILAISLAANAALLATFAFKPALVPPAVRDFFHPAAAQAASTEALASARRGAEAASRKAARADAARAQTWARLQSDDLATLIARLRAAGFSPAIVRAIVSAQIETRFRARLSGLVGTLADTPYWKPEPFNSISNAKLWEEYNQAFRDRTKLLRQLLGDEYFAGEAATDAQRRQFGNLPRAKIDLIQQINDDYAEMLSQVRAATQGIMLPEDREKIALLEREKRADLAALLSPQELEDYEMRSSRITSRLRQAFTVMDASEQEFRAIFQALQPHAETLYPSGPGGLADFQTRRSVQQQVNDQLKATLGDARYADYQRATNNEYQQLYRLAQRENVPVEAATRVFDLRDKTAADSMQIYSDRNLSYEQKRTALQTLAEAAKARIIGELGSTAGEAYVKNARWLTYLGGGGAVSVLPEGGMSLRPLRPNNPTSPTNLPATPTP